VAVMQAGRVADDPTVRATQERLTACTYAMAHPETGELVPACVQHSVLDPGENERLRRLLPLTVVDRRASAGRVRPEPNSQPRATSTPGRTTST